MTGEIINIELNQEDAELFRRFRARQNEILALALRENMLFLSTQKQERTLNAKFTGTITIMMNEGYVNGIVINQKIL